MFSLERLGLLRNPFNPAIAEERPPELLVIVGDEHKKIRKIVEHRFLEAKKAKIMNFVVLRGRRGTGKSAIVRDFLLHRLKLKDSQIIDFRLDKELNFALTLAYFIKKILEQHKPIGKFFIGDSVIKDILSKELTELDYDSGLLVDKLFDILLKFKTGIPVIIVWDQLENLILREEEQRSFLNFIRNISATLPKRLNAGVLFIITITPEKYIDLRNALRDEIAFIRNLESGALEMPMRLELKDVKELFAILLNKVRVRSKILEEKLKVYPYYPFTEDAIKAIYDFADGVPGTIYELAKNVLEEAAVYPGALDIIDERFVHDRILEISVEWYRALALPIVPLHDMLMELLDGAKELGVIREYQRLVMSLNSYPYILEAFGIRKLIEEGKIPKDEADAITKKHILDYIVVYEREEGYYLTLVRTARITIRSDVANGVSALLNRMLGFKYGISTIRKERIKYILLTYGSIGKTVKSILEQASITSGVPVDILEININSPYIYGKVRSIYERIIRLKRMYGKLRAIPIRTRTTLESDINEALSVLGIIRE